MALVKTPRALVLQQAAADRLRAIPRHDDVGRQRIRRAVLFAGHRGDAFVDAVALPGARSQRAHWCVADPGGHGNSAAGHWRDADDHRLAIRVVLDRCNAFRLARRSTGFDAALALDGSLDWLRVFAH